MIHRTKFWYIAFIFLIGNNEALSQNLLFGGNHDNQGSAICQDNAGGFLILGTSRNGPHGGDDFHLIRINQHGCRVWEKYFGDLHQDRGKSIIQTRDGHFVFFGYSWDNGPGRFDYFLAKINIDGQLLWSKIYGGGHYDEGYRVKELSDGGFGLIGYSKSMGNSGDYLFLKTDSEGELIWSAAYDLNNKDYGFDFAETSNGGLLLFGTTNGFHDNSLQSWYTSNANASMLRINQDGNFALEKIFGGPEHDFGMRIIPDGNDNFYLFGSTQSEGNGKFDFWLQKVDQTGIPLYSKTYGGNEFEYGSSMDLDAEGNLFLIGTSKSYGTENTPDIWVIKTNQDGEEIWSLTLGDAGEDYGNDIIALNNGGCAIVGTFQNPDSGKDEIFFAKISPQGQLESFATPMENEYAFSVFPNPAFSSEPVTLKAENFCKNFEYALYDASGSLVNSDFVEGDIAQLQNEQLSKGIYFLTIEVEGQQKLQSKLIIR